jgi:hypothetical protein
VTAASGDTGGDPIDIPENIFPYGERNEIYTRNFFYNPILDLDRRDYMKENIIYRPAIDVDFLQDRKQLTPAGILTLGSVIAETSTTIVFEIVENPTAVIKYTTNCMDAGIHPSVRDYTFLRMIENDFRNMTSLSGISTLNSDTWFRAPDIPTPRVYYISPPVRHTLIRKSIKSNFKLGRGTRWINCVENFAQIRYVIMDRVYASMNELTTQPPTGGVFPIDFVMRMGISVIEAIRYLHDRGIVHNDIHAGNIVLSQDGTKFLLIDFGRSLLMDPNTRHLQTNRLYDMGEKWDDPLNSPWELEGYEQSVRDDLYKVLESMARMLDGHVLANFLKSFNNDARKLYEWKMHENPFEFLSPQGVNNFDVFQRIKRRRIVERFGRIVKMVLSIKNGNRIDIFDQLLSSLNDLHSYIVSKNL